MKLDLIVNVCIVYSQYEKSLHCYYSVNISNLNLVKHSIRLRMHGSFSEL